MFKKKIKMECPIPDDLWIQILNTYLVRKEHTMLNLASTSRRLYEIVHRNLAEIGFTKSLDLKPILVTFQNIKILRVQCFSQCYSVRIPEMKHLEKLVIQDCEDCWGWKEYSRYKNECSHRELVTSLVVEKYPRLKSLSFTECQCIKENTLLSIQDSMKNQLTMLRLGSRIESDRFFKYFPSLTRLGAFQHDDSFIKNKRTNQLNYLKIRGYDGRDIREFFTAFNGKLVVCTDFSESFTKRSVFIRNGYFVFGDENKNDKSISC